MNYNKRMELLNEWKKENKHWTYFAGRGLTFLSVILNLSSIIHVIIFNKVNIFLCFSGIIACITMIIFTCIWTSRSNKAKRKFFNSK